MTHAKYQDIPIRECGEPLVDLAGSDFVLEPQYYLQGLSDNPRQYLRSGVAQRLLLAQQDLGGRKIKIWDAFRPRKIQQRIYDFYWQKAKNAHPGGSEEQLRHDVGIFVARADDPSRVPPHASGGAIDLTLVDKNGKELEMGTTFDFFGPEAATLYFEELGRNKTVRANRRLLRDALESQGFRVDREEWWHFDYGNQLWALDLNLDAAIYGEIQP